MQLNSCSLEVQQNPDYGLQETRLEYDFPPHVAFSSHDTEDRVPVLAVLCKCSIVYGKKGPTGSHNYVCPFAYDINTNALLSAKPTHDT